MTFSQKTWTAMAMIAAGLIPWVAQQNAQLQLRGEIQSLQSQVGRIPQLQAEHESLSNLVTRAKNSQERPRDRFQELLKLRGEVGSLRQRTNQLEQLATENLRASQELI